MSQLETTIPFMKELHQLLSEKATKLNGELKALDVRGVDFDGALLRINQQIASAETKYTIAFVGTFKTGKSTIINSLLELKGEARLSSEFDPDTAKCIRIMKKPKGQRYDAEIIFVENAYPNEQISWQEAKKYTSQVAIDSAGGLLADKADKIEEVRYFVDNPILDICNILDLPGTGTGRYEKHNEVTNRKIMEADCVFWVVSTDNEPDMSSIDNLKKIRSKMLPIINVWQCEAEDIFAPISPDEMKEILLTQYEAYFASAEAPLCYYAREIDLAQQEGRELKEEWGKAAFSDKVQELLSNIQTGDRMKRIKDQLRTALDTCEAQLNAALEDEDLKSVKNTDQTEETEILRLKSKFEKARRLASGNIKNQAKTTAQDILGVFSDASDAFIDIQMQGMNFMSLFSKRRIEEKLKRDFEDNYVRLKSGWLDKTAQQYVDDINDILKGIYIDMAFDLEKMSDSSTTMSIQGSSLSGFIDDMAGLIKKDMVAKITPTIVAMIATGILMFIPGGLVIESIAGVVLGGFNAAKNLPNDDKLRQKATMIKTAAKVQIRQQKAEMVMRLIEEGTKLNALYMQQIEEVLKQRASDNQRKMTQLVHLENNIKEMLDFVGTQKDALEKL